MNTIKEKCSCGAEIEVHSDSMERAQQAMNEWREVHVGHGELSDDETDMRCWGCGHGAVSGFHLPECPMLR